MTPAPDAANPPVPPWLNVLALYRDGEWHVYVYDDGSRAKVRVAVSGNAALSVWDRVRLIYRVGREGAA